MRRLAAIAAALAVLPVAALAAPPPLGNGSVRSVRVAATGPFHALDATPDPAGTRIYFTTTRPGILSVPIGGGTVRAVALRGPLVSPTGIAVSRDGKRLYVADERAANGGAIFVVPAGGGRPVPLAGTVGTRPRGLDVVGRPGRERIYYSGSNPHADGQPAVFSIPASGGAAQPVAEGSPLARPEGVAAAANGSLYVTDRRAGAVFRIHGGAATPVARGLHLGTPAGVALSRDGSLLLVSALSGGHARVLVIALPSGRRGAVTKVVGANVGAGGLHRARAAKVFAWAGRRPNGDGAVYRVDPS